MRHFEFVSGNDWFGDKNAPWNQPDAVYVTCPHCKGSGGIWLSEDGREATKEGYELLTEEDKAVFEFFECEHCEGIGTIETY